MYDLYDIDDFSEETDDNVSDYKTDFNAELIKSEYHDMGIDDLTIPVC